MHDIPQRRRPGGGGRPARTHGDRSACRLSSWQAHVGACHRGGHPFDRLDRLQSTCGGGTMQASQK
eukprot:scaffold324_cov326-Pavlova_lutheri.AAC.20